MEEYGKTRNFAYRNHREDRFDCLQPRKKMLKRRTPPEVFRAPSALAHEGWQVSRSLFSPIHRHPASAGPKASRADSFFVCAPSAGMPYSKAARLKGASSKCHTESKARKLVYSTASSQFVTLEVAFHP